MKINPLRLLLVLLGVLAITTSAQSQTISLLLEDDQLLKNGRKAVHSGNLEKAMFFYEEALKRSSLSRLELIDVHNGLCVTYMYLEYFEEAIVQCKAALRIQSNKWDTMNNLGTVHLVMGNYSEAIKIYEKGLKMKPKYKILLFNMEIAQKRSLEARIRLEIEQEKNGFQEDDRYQGSAALDRKPQ
ncbi:MAG: tetratricopeptide repeat protein [Sphingomonadales bacterium]